MYSILPLCSCTFFRPPRLQWHFYTILCYTMCLRSLSLYLQLQVTAILSNSILVSILHILRVRVGRLKNPLEGCFTASFAVVALSCYTVSQSTLVTRTDKVNMILKGCKVVHSAYLMQLYEIVLLKHRQQQAIQQVAQQGGLSIKWYHWIRLLERHFVWLGSA